MGIGNARAGVLEVNHNTFSRILPFGRYRNRDIDVPLILITHSLKGVAQQVEEDLLDLNGIDRNCRNVIRGRQIDMHIRCGKADKRQLVRTLNDFNDVAMAALGLLLFYH